MLSRFGEAMSKSKPNVIPIAEVPSKFSVDLTRLHLASIATPETVLEWKDTEVKFAQQRLKKFWEYALSVVDVARDVNIEYSFPSKVLLSSVKTNLKKALEEIEKFNARDYILGGYYANIRVLDEYHKLAVNLPKEEKMAVLREVIEMIVVIIAPVIPHICEELNERMGSKDYISLKRIPEITIDKEDTLYALQAKFMTNLQEDIDQIVKLVKSKPNKIHIYINAEWKNDLYKLATNLFKDEAVQIGRIMSSAKENNKLNKYINEIATEAKQMLKDPTIFRIEMLSPEDQKKAIQGYEEYISKRFNNAEIIIQIADDEKIHDPQNKANKARPMKPALLLE